MRALTLLAPGQAGYPALDRAPQQPVPTRVELDGVDAVAEAIMRVEHRHVALGPARVLARLDAAGHGAGLAHAIKPPVAALAHERLLQHEVDLEQVDRLQRRRLIENSASGV